MPIATPGRLSLLGICLLTFLSASAQGAANMTFYNVYGDQQETALALSGINHIAQDPQGFLWFGGETGLGRYDSQTTRIYRHSADDPHSLAHDFVRGLGVDRAGVMWVGTEAALCTYEARVDRFDCNLQFGRRELPRKGITSLTIGRDNQIYVGSQGGFFIISADRREWRAYHLPAGPVATPESNFVMAVAEDLNGRLWLGTADNGLVFLDPISGATQAYRADPAAPHSLSHNKIRSLAFDNQQRLWIATYGGGVNVFDPISGRFSNFSAQTGPGQPLSQVMWQVFRDSRDTLWLAADQGGLVRYDPEHGFIPQRHRPYDRTSLPSDQVRAIYEDRNGDLWIGSFPSGVSFYNRANGHVKNFTAQLDQPTSISHSSILALHRDTTGRVWIGTEDGLNLFDAERGEFVRYRQWPDTGLAVKAVLSIAQFDEHTLWIGTWSGGLFAFDLQTRKFRPVDTQPPAIGQGNNSSGQGNSLFIWDVMRDRNGDMWIATEFEGVGRYRRAEGRFEFLQHNPDDPNSLAGNFAWDVMEDREGNVWIATYAGLSRWNRAQERMERVAPNGEIGSDRLTSLMEDRDGDIWIGSQDNGVFLYERREQRFRHLGAAAGMPSLAVSGMIQDSKGAIWLLTTNGLVHLDKNDLVPQVFSTENGLAGRNFNRRAALLSDTGELLIGSADGLSVFDPADMQVADTAFPVWLTDLRLLNRRVPIQDQGSHLAQALSFTRALHLSHRDLMFSIDFAALNYRMRQHTRYSYRLQGFDPDWNEIGRHNSATYTNLPPGDYVFQVRALSGEKKWIHSDDLHIHVAAAPWRSNWALMGYAAGMMLLGYLLAHYWKMRSRSRVYHARSTTDPLTGLYNRLALQEFAQRLFCCQRPAPICVLFIDVDNFKRINDRRGHDSGDRILQEVARLCQSCVRQNDLLARWGGEEFVLLCSGVDEQAGYHLGEKLRGHIAQHIFDAAHSPLKVTISVGVAVAHESESFDETWKRADQALYVAKNQGRNCVIVAAQVKPAERT
jgi:two-component system sensor histidine kinase ChiS